MKKTTKQNYQERLSRVIEYIYKNLDGDLSVNRLAELAHMSPYHFHRIYRGLAQESLNASIRRLRLQHAAAELIRSDQPICNIAKSVSYGSKEAFSRAFALYFGENPSDYRVRHQLNEQTLACNFAALPINSQEYTDMYDIEMMEFDEINLVGYEHQGDYMNIGEVFEKLFIYANSHDFINDKTRSIGVYYNDPKSCLKEKLHSMACITADLADMPKGEAAPQSFNIPAGKYATLLFKGSYAELEKPYSWLFGQWLPQSGFEADDFPPFEEYLNYPKDTAPQDLLTRIHCKLKV